MSGSLQQRMVGGSRFGSSTAKRMGSYNQGAMKQLGHTNGVVKKQIGGKLTFSMNCSLIFAFIFSLIG